MNLVLLSTSKWALSQLPDFARRGEGEKTNDKFSLVVGLGAVICSVIINGGRTSLPSPSTKLSQSKKEEDERRKPRKKPAKSYSPLSPPFLHFLPISPSFFFPLSLTHRSHSPFLASIPLSLSLWCCKEYHSQIVSSSFSRLRLSPSVEDQVP